MPAPAASKRVRGVQIHRPFTFGSEAIPFDPDNKPKDAPAGHTHRWRVFVRGIPIPDPANPGRVKYTDISHWLKKVQFKLHETYAQAVRMVESPENGQFFVEETGWGEFEVGMRFYFVPESGEKPQQLFHFLKLHPYTGDVEKQKAERKQVNSICYEEVVFNEPVEAFYDILTGGGEKASAKSKKQIDLRTAEIPMRSTDGAVWSREEEGKELDRLGEAINKVEQMIEDEKAQLIVAEKELAELEKTEGKVQKKR